MFSIFFLLMYYMFLSSNWIMCVDMHLGTHGCKRTIRAPRTKCTQKCSPQSGCGSDKYKCLCDGSCGFSCVDIGKL